MHREVTVIDKIESFIKKSVPGYTYFMGDFMHADGSFVYWNLSEVVPPTQAEIDAEVPVKVCPATCVECILTRLTNLEDTVKELQDELASFE